MARLVRFAGCGLILAAAGCVSPQAAPAPVIVATPVATQAAAPATERVRWASSIVSREAAWYSSPEARAIADSVLLYQSREGGWPKNTDLAVPPRSAADLPPANMSNTIDNNGTTLPMQFLARVIQATGDARYVQAFNRGFDYLIAAQYPNGGWPQFYPLREGYYSRITFNDDAIVRVARLLRDAAEGEEQFAFVDPRRRAIAAAAVARTTDLILRTQIVQNGRRTAWAAQYDERTLAPAPARAFEPASLSGSESVGIVRFLMSIDNPSPEVIAAVEGAVQWFQDVRITGMRLEDFTDAQGQPDKRLVPDPAAEPLWARFYDLRTNRPIFTSRDAVIHDRYDQIERERRTGYAFIGTWPAQLLAREYPRWRQRVGRSG
jgi:PelA/Pel-15E family pectate lyase